MPFYKRSSAYNELETCQIKQLRREATQSEKILWKALRENRNFLKMKCRRQHPIGPYIADFFCYEKQLVVELDGLSHDSRQNTDRRRDAFMASLGIKVLRYGDADVLQDVHVIIEDICNKAGI